MNITTKETVPTTLPLFTYISCAYAMVLSIVAVIENGLLTLAYTKDPTGRIQAPGNHYTSLCINDFLMACVAVPLFIYDRFNVVNTKTVSHIVTNLSFFITIISSMLHILTLVFDRFVAIRWAFWYRTNTNVLKSRFIWLAIWCIALFAGTASMFADKVLYSLGVSSVHTLTYLIALSISFTGVSRKLEKQENTFIAPIKRKNAFIPDKLDASFVFPIEGRVKEYRRPRTDSTAMLFFARKDRVQSLYRLLFAVALLILLPSCVLNYVNVYCNWFSLKTHLMLTDIYLLLAMTTCALNPILLALRLTVFHRSIKLILCCHKNNILGKKTSNSSVASNLPLIKSSIKKSQANQKKERNIPCIHDTNSSSILDCNSQNVKNMIL